MFSVGSTNDSTIFTLGHAKLSRSFERFLDDLREQFKAFGGDLIGAKQEYNCLILLHNFSKHLYTISVSPVDPIFPD